jgi:hypothetical protein
LLQWCPDALVHSRESAKRDEKPANGPSALPAIRLASERKGEENSLKLTERCGNVIENKGSLWKTWMQSRNVYENKGSYPHNAGISLKIQVVSSR